MWHVLCSCEETIGSELTVSDRIKWANGPKKMEMGLQLSFPKPGRETLKEKVQTVERCARVSKRECLEEEYCSVWM